MRICIDLDGVVCKLRKPGQTYSELEPVPGAIEKIQKLRENGHYIIIYTARHMKTCEGNVGKILARQGLVTLKWLDDHKVDYDEIYFGKPWAQVYLDDNAFRFTSWRDIADDGSNLPISREEEAKKEEPIGIINNPTREETILAVLSAGDGEPYKPSQIQKIFFLIDQEISDYIGGRKFDFKPVGYGPFDKTICEELESLVKTGEVIVSRDNSGKWNNHSLSVKGQRRGEALFACLPSEAQDYIKKVSEVVQTLSFAELVSAIYKKYPKMRENSVFQ